MISEENSLSKIIEFIDASNQNTVVISHLIHRDIGGCLEICGGCCKRVTLDYFEGSSRWERFKSLFPEKVADFTRHEIGAGVFYSNAQMNNNTGFCQYLDRKTGLCTIHEARPMLCQSTPLKFKQNPTRNRVILTSETYGRKHAFRRVDGGRGAKCKMLPVTDKRVQEDIEFLEELKRIAEVFQLQTAHLERIIHILKTRQRDSQSITIQFLQ